MPDLTGFEVLEQLKASPATRDIQVVVYTALALGANDRARLATAVTILRKSTSSRVADRAAIDDQLQAVVAADAERMTQLLDNLITNAIRYGTGAITLRLARTGETAVITVHNHGTPIAADQLASLLPTSGGRGRTAGSASGSTSSIRSRAPTAAASR